MVITRLDDIIQLTNRLEEETAYVYPVAVDAFLHPVQNKLSSLHFRFDDGISRKRKINKNKKNRS